MKTLRRKLFFLPSHMTQMTWRRNLSTKVLSSHMSVPPYTWLPEVRVGSGGLCFNKYIAGDKMLQLPYLIEGVVIFANSAIQIRADFVQNQPSCNSLLTSDPAGPVFPAGHQLRWSSRAFAPTLSRAPYLEIARQYLKIHLILMGATNTKQMKFAASWPEEETMRTGRSKRTKGHKSCNEIGQIGKIGQIGQSQNLRHGGGDPAADNRCENLWQKSKGRQEGEEQ